MAKVFLSYSTKDRAHLETFRKHAEVLQASGLATFWRDQEVKPGEPWAAEIRRELDTARLVVALISPEFLESKWCISELTRAFELRENRLIDVVPIIVRQCDWRKTPLGAIQALPAGGAPIESFPDPDLAWRDAVAGLEDVVRGERRQPALPTRQQLVLECAHLLNASRRLMLLAPWRGGLDELAQEVARRTHGDQVTTLRIPTLPDMTAAEFYSEVSGEPSVNSGPEFRRWLMRRSTPGPATVGHLVVMPYFSGPKELIREMGRIMRGVFDERGTFSLLALGRSPCAELLSDDHFSLFSGIITKHVGELDLQETETVLQGLGADPMYAGEVQSATGGHPEWTALAARQVCEGRFHGLPKYLSDTMLFGILRDRLMRLDRERQGSSHAGRTLEKLLNNESVVRLFEARNDLRYPEVRLYFDGALIERDERTQFRCEAARLAAEDAVRVWKQAQ